MPFLKRLGFYLIGLALGLVFLTFVLKKKTAQTGTEFCYFPNCRVLKDLRSKPIVFSDSLDALIAERELDSAEIHYFLREGSIDFSKSDTRSKPCTSYLIESELKGREANMHIDNCDSIVRVMALTYVLD